MVHTVRVEGCRYHPPSSGEKMGWEQALAGFAKGCIRGKKRIVITLAMSWLWGEGCQKICLCP